MKVRIDNPLPVPFVNVKLIFRAENLLTRETLVHEQDASVKAKGTEEFSIEVKGRYCGTVVLTLTGIKVFDVFGLIFFKSNCAVKNQFTIAPELIDMRVVIPMSNHISEDSEQYSPYKPGFDYSEVFQVREYKEGDSPKQIHWKLTSKFDSLISKDPGLPLEKSVVLFWERENIDNRETAAQSSAMVEVVVSICRAIIEQGVFCRIIWNEKGQDTYSELLIREEDDLYAMLPKLLSAGGSEESVVDLYLRLTGQENQSRIVYVGTHKSAMLENLCDGESLTSFICVEEDANEEGTYCFSPENMEEQLYEIVLN